MLRRLWSWLKNFFRSLLGMEATDDTSSASKGISDTEYESLFLRLLDGVSEGWDREQVNGFLSANYITQSDLIAWLQRFGEKLMASNLRHDELAIRMVRLISCGELGKVAYDIGMRLLKRETVK